jgi:hypothetical protein
MMTWMFPERATLHRKHPTTFQKNVYFRGIQAHFRQQNKQVIKQHPALCKLQLAWLAGLFI